MITVSVEQLMSAIEEAGAFKIPDMNEGTDYLYNNLYRRLSRGEDVRLSEIYYGSFELDDVDFMREMYSETLEANEYKADSITQTLRGIPPIVAAAVFV
jgi:hypothetical protein